MNRPRSRLFLIAAALVSAVLAAGGACSVDLENGAPRFNQDPEPAEPIGTSVTIRFRNLTAVDAVDVEFYGSNEPLENLPDDLLAAANLVTTSIGVAGTGIIEPFSEDVIDFPCSENLTIGTRGGSFLDNETGEPRGVGTPRWAQEGPLALCGSVVTLEFSGGDGEFTTVMSIGP